MNTPAGSRENQIYPSGSPRPPHPSYVTKDNSCARQNTSRARLTLGGIIGRGHLVAALAGVMMASILLTLMSVLALRAYANHNLNLIARSISYAVKPALLLNDELAATKVMTLIVSREDISDAKLFNTDGEILSHWQRPETGMISVLKQHLNSVILNESIRQPILYHDHEVGQIRLASHGSRLMYFLFSGLAGIVICTAISARVALFLAHQQLLKITNPLLSFAAVAHQARRGRTQGHRIKPVQIVELDNFGSDFNALLDELDSRHAYLQTKNDRLAYQANHDSLTGLPNRGFFERRLNRVMEHAKKREERIAVLFLDSDQFKKINDDFGHRAGDLVLVSAAKRMRSQLREDDLVARIGGDEFAILLWPIAKLKDAKCIVKKISAAMNKPVILENGSEIMVSFSIGIAVYPDDGDTIERLINVSDKAMYQSKYSSRTKKNQT